MLRPLDINKVSYKKYKFSGNEVKIKLSATEVLKNKKLIELKFYYLCSSTFNYG